MNLHVHFHVVALDGVYESAVGPDPILERPDAPPLAPAFIPCEPPSAAEVAAVVQRIATRVARWARRKGHSLGAPFESPDDFDPAIQLVHVGASRGHYATLARDGRTALADDDAEFVPRRASLRAASFEQFNVHADVTVRAGDRDARERLCRYGARPPFSLDRVSVLDDGRVAYRVKYPGPRGQTHRMMTPFKFMARLSALIPPPRYPLVRYSGVLAPNARLRRRIVPRAERSTHARLELVRRAKRDGRDRTRADDACAMPSAGCEPSVTRRDAEPGIDATHGGAPNDVAVRGSGPPSQRPGRDGSYIDWASLLRRVYGVDALACARCGGRLVGIAMITWRDAIASILRHVGESATGPPPARVLAPWPLDAP